MPQQTNLNVSPYFDDFDPDNDFHRVLFKPGYPVQARELTGLQSMLQNQIEKFGKHFFKEGAKVIPGNTGYTQLYYCVQLNNNFQGVPVTAYADQLVGTKITGKTSGVTAVVSTVLYPQDSERDILTLYVSYLSSNTQNNTTQTFSNGEELSSNVIITSGLLGNTTIAANSSFATTVANNASATGSAFQIQDGVYFIRGNFVNVDTETLLLDQYSNTPSYRIGLYIDETIVNADMDESLNDNSQGFNNYAAPGADRLRIATRLFKKPLDDFNDDNFVELAVVKEGVLQTKTAANTTYSSNFMEILARRTYAESGDYYVNPFDITFENSLNDNVGNRGIFQEGQFTPGGSTPSDGLGLYKVSPGKAFVKGWEVETISPTFLDVEKPRTTSTVEDFTFAYNTGPTLKINRVDGSPTIGIGNTYIVSLRDQRVGYTTSSLPGKEVGLARVYDYRLESGSYSTSNGNQNEWEIALYDVQTVTEIAVSTACTLTVPTFIKGSNSGATAFLKDAVTAGTALTVYETNGNFIPNESLVIDGIPDGRIAIAITDYGIGAVKSLYGTNNGVIGVNTFTADVIQSTAFNVGIVTISKGSGANYISTVSTPDANFPGPVLNPVVKENDLVSYTDIAVSATDPIYGRVVSVGADDITITGITSVTGIVDGKLPTVGFLANDFKVLTTKLDQSSDRSLYTQLPRTNVANVDLTDASITIRKTQLVNIVNNQLSAFVVAGDNETFLPYDAERYALLRSDGTTEPLTSNAVEITLGSTRLQIQNLGSNDTDAQLITTLKKVKPKAKEKIRKRVNSILVDKTKLEGSGITTTTLNNGLTFGNYPYGTRVEDSTISLNSPDVIQVHGIFEMATVPSEDNNDPSAPKMTLGSLTSSTTTTSEFVIGEQIIGQTSGAIAIVAEKVTSTQISFIHQNDITFKEGEVIVAEESLIEGSIVTLDSSSFNITENFKFNDGQKSTFLNYGAIVRKTTATAPEKRIKVYFSNGYYESTDDGDITTVNSYNTFNYANEIAVVDGISESDIIDIRPRVSDYTVAADARSPLEFYGRTFNASGQSAANPLASDEDIKVTFSYYQGRIDRIFLTKDGAFEVKYGTPSDSPDRPGPVDDAVEVARITLPPYLYRTADAELEFLEHKRFRMVDIKRLEDRIKNLEYYTTLSLMEVNTANMFVPDADGLNRFKSGFFVDNFSSFTAQEDRAGINNSIDRKNNEGRPLHYTNSVDLIFGPVTNPNPSADLQFSSILENNVTKQNDTLTLAYTSIEWLKQHFATRSESVTPFLISFWQGSLELTPASDTWVDTVRLDAKIIQTEGDYERVMNSAIEAGTVDPQTGFGPMIWNGWQTNWTGTDVITTTRTRSERIGWRGQGPGGRHRQYRGTLIDREIRDTLREQIDVGTETREGMRTTITESFDEHSVGDRVVSRDLIPYMRARNVEFDGKRMKPLTRMYAFFDGVDVSKYCVPKLLEIEMSSGVFQVGETVVGRTQSTGLGEDNNDTSARITFRVAQSNHREGEYDLPTKIYPENPYTNQVLPEAYSSTSTILNVDTYSLSNEAQGAYFGWVDIGMDLVGESSGAQAAISDLRLVSDLAASIKGSYYIPNPNNINFPRFETGSKTFTLVNDEDNDQNTASTIAEEAYTAAGTLETVQENIVSVRNARIEQKQEFQERAVTRTTGLQVVGSQVISENRQENAVVGWYDPLAQSFLVDEETGVFITECDIFFRSKDDMDVPMVFQIRSMKGGFPTQHIVPFSEIVLDPGDITTSGDGSVPTTIRMKAPVYLEGGNEYAICLASNSTKYSVYISRIGENDLLTQTYISNQPYLGSLFKSQNASTWEASQWEDLKFTLYRADFEDSGSVELYNPQLTKGNNQIPKLMPDSLNLISRTVRVGLGTTVADTGLQVGQIVSQEVTNATGRLVGVAGSATGSLTVSKAGIGYTPADGSRTVAGVNLVTISGNGRGAVGSVSVTNGAISAATITGGGTGYQVGDVVGFTTLGVNSVGRDCRLSIVSIGMTSELVLNSVQGDFTVGAAKTIQYTNNAGNTVNLNAGYGGNVQVASTVVGTDGLHIKVDHRNHGMYFDDNLVQISDARSDVKPTKLSTPLDIGTTTGSISVVDGSKFGLFESVGVGTTNYGYLEIGGNGYGTGEIISYESVSGNTIGITTRGASPSTYPVGTPIYKYELGGVSLKRINKIHSLADADSGDAITFDSYPIRLDMSQDGTDRTVAGYPSLYLNSTKSSGGYKIRATQNMPFEILTPIVQNVSVRGTSVTGEVRTITGQSIDGNEIPWLDAGFESVTPNTSNYFTTPRMIASKINEDLKLSTLPGNKSMNMRLFLNTTDSRLSPVIDAQRLAVITTSNRVNDVVTDFASDSRVNGIDTDPTACQYVSKEVILENSATSIKVFVDAHINVNSDIRAFYSISNNEGGVPIFTPFPGFNNLNSRGQVIALNDSDGQSDAFIPKVNSNGFESGELEFNEYVFTADPLPSFKTYRVKFVLTSQSQVYVPRIKKLRVMALA